MKTGGKAYKDCPCGDRKWHQCRPGDCVMEKQGVPDDRVGSKMGDLCPDCGRTGRVGHLDNCPSRSKFNPDMDRDIPFTDPMAGGLGATADMETVPIATGERVVMEQVFNVVAAAEADKRRPEGEKVYLPEHYARFPIEPVHFICANNLNFFQGNIIKYVLRHDKKNGLEDLRKAARYLDMFIRFVEKDPDWWK